MIKVAWDMSGSQCLQLLLTTQEETVGELGHVTRVDTTVAIDICHHRHGDHLDQHMLAMDQ